MAEQTVRYCTSADGTRIAYAVTAGDKPGMLFVAGWPSSISLVAELYGRNLAERIAFGREFVCYDRRGTGSSDRKVDDISLPRQVEDVAAVIGDYGDDVNIYGGWDGTPICIAYAAMNPERVGRMVLGGAYARGADIISREALQSTVNTARTNWAFTRRSLAAIGGAAGDQVSGYMETLRRSHSGEMAALYLEQYGTMDVAEYLDQVTTPTLVIHRPSDGAVPRAATEYVASRIPNCRFQVVADRDAHQAAARGFLWESDGASPPVTEHALGTLLRTILFTDLVGHTAMMSRLGDERGRAVLREHERITREVLKANGGTEVKTMGDGFMASFGSVTKSVECAIALQKAFADREGEPLSIRVGLNAGEPIEEDGDLFGATVIPASLIAAKAEGGEILVADTVRGLCSGKGFLFADRGEFTAKGFEEAVRVHEVKWRK